MNRMCSPLSAASSSSRACRKRDALSARASCQRQRMGEPNSTGAWASIHGMTPDHKLQSVVTRAHPWRLECCVSFVELIIDGFVARSSSA